MFNKVIYVYVVGIRKSTNDAGQNVLFFCFFYFAFDI